jgi:hypothetical protein
MGQSLKGKTFCPIPGLRYCHINNFGLDCYGILWPSLARGKSSRGMNVEIIRRKGITQMVRFTFLVLCCLGFWWPGHAVQAQMQLLPSLDGATLEKYQGLQLDSRIHITRTYMDHEKWGFFKIGLIPVQVVDGVDLQIHSADSLTNALTFINSGHLSAAAQRHLELRKLEISLLGEKEPRLGADTASIVRPGALQLSHVSVSNGGEAISIPGATLQVTGPDCGCLRWNSPGGQNQMFVFQTSKN